MKIIITIGILFSFLIGHSQTSDARKSLDNNECFVATTNSLSVTAAIGGTMHNILTISNPIGSGAKIFIDYFQFFVNGTNLLIPTASTIFVNPTLVTANIAPKFNLKIGSTVTDNTTVFGYDLRTAALSGAITSPYEIPQNSGDKFGGGKLEIMEGQSIGIDLSKSVGLGVAMSSGILMVYYHKIPN